MFDVDLTPLPTIAETDAQPAPTGWSHIDADEPEGLSEADASLAADYAELLAVPGFPYRD